MTSCTCSTFTQQQGKNLSPPQSFMLASCFSPERNKITYRENEWNSKGSLQTYCQSKALLRPPVLGIVSLLGTTGRSCPSWLVVVKSAIHSTRDRYGQHQRIRWIIWILALSFSVLTSWVLDISLVVACLLVNAIHIKAFVRSDLNEEKFLEKVGDSLDPAHIVLRKRYTHISFH